jgi:hypothetical protein
MYCKACGHRGEGRAEFCPKCGTVLSASFELVPAGKSKLRWRIPVLATVLSLVVFVGLPRMLLQTDLESSGPTDKLRFLRAFQQSAYRRIGQREVRFSGQTLVVIWDLRWMALEESKQQEIVGIVGRAWHIVGGADTVFRIEGLDGDVASYANDEVHLGP